MIQRNIITIIDDLKDKFPIIALTGPRQSGKTTLLKNRFPTYKYVSLEDPDMRNFAQNDPKGFLNTYNAYIIFDEVQRVPQLFSYLQAVVDASGIMGQFILSGSQNFHLVQQITQSLAGRVALFKLLPFDLQELKSANLLPERYEEAIVRGAYPALFDRKIPSAAFYANYLATYIQRDVAELLHVHDHRTFRAFLGLCASRVGQLLNISSLANECGISQPTAKAWLSILESSYIIFLLPPYFQNYSKRIVKNSKLYFYDTGLVSHLLGIKMADSLAPSPIKGSLFENLIIAEMQKQNQHQYLHQELYFWRDSNGNEIDLLIPNATKFDIFEIKSSQTILTDHFKGLDFFEKLAPDNIANKTLIYGGHEPQNRSKGAVRSWAALDSL